jgi:dihydrodipicolinate synthase/N-acetylneuraminate lyase
MTKKLMTGSFVALIAPFNRNGSVDFEAFRTLLKFQELGLDKKYGYKPMSVAA